MLLEYVTLKKMREIIGWPDGRGDGIFSPGMFAWKVAQSALTPLCLTGDGTGCVCVCVCCNVPICILMI